MAGFGSGGCAAAFYLDGHSATGRYATMKNQYGIFEPDDGVSLTLAECARVGAAVAQALVRLGVTLPAENRLALSRRLVGRFADELAEVSDEEVPALTAAQQNILEAFIIVTVCERTGHASVRRKLDALLSGTMDPANELRTQARDEQFELLVWALLVLGGFPSTEVGEPDLIVLTPSGRFGIAVKRVSSANALSRHIKKAVKQIRAHVPSGVIAVNVDAQLLGMDPESTRQFVAGAAVRVHELVEARGGLDVVEAVLVSGVTFDRSMDGTPRLSYDLSFRVLAAHEAEQERIERNLSAMGRRIRDGVLSVVAAAAG